MAADRTFSVTEAAVILRRTAQTIRNWITAGMPATQAGRKGSGQEVRISLADALEWNVARAIERAAGSAGKADAEELKRRKLAAETELSELEAATAAGRVVSVDEVAAVLAPQLDRVRVRLLAIPSKCAPLVAPDPEIRSCQATLQQQVDEALNELVGYAEGQRGATGDGGVVAGDAAPPAAAADGKRMGRPRKAAVIRSKRRAGAVGHRP